jgi:hypothetical protein
MVTIHTVENAKDVTTAMRGNFIKIVDKKTGTVSITFLNGKGKMPVTLDYDVQAAVLDLVGDRDHLTRLVRELKLRADLERLRDVVSDAQPAAVPTEIRGDDSLSRWIAHAKVIKGIFVEARP